MAAIAFGTDVFWGFRPNQTTLGVAFRCIWFIQRNSGALHTTNSDQLWGASGEEPTGPPERCNDGKRNFAPDGTPIITIPPLGGDV